MTRTNSKQTHYSLTATITRDKKEQQPLSTNPNTNPTVHKNQQPLK